MTPRTVGIVVFDEAEVLDVAGPYEVFSVAGLRHGLEPFRVLLVAERDGPVTARNGFGLVAHATLATAPRLDLLLVPGGFGTRSAMHREEFLAAVRRRADDAEFVLSVCTGALVLARAGLLDGLDATTHHAALDLLRATAPAVRVHEGVRFTDNGRVLTSAGVAAGIDMSLHMVDRLLGRVLAEVAARYMEYPWRPGAGA